MRVGRTEGGSPPAELEPRADRMSGEVGSPTDRAVRQSSGLEVTSVTCTPTGSRVLEGAHTSILVNSGLMRQSGGFPEETVAESDPKGLVRPSGVSVAGVERQKVVLGRRSWDRRGHGTLRGDKWLQMARARSTKVGALKGGAMDAHSDTYFFKRLLCAR